MNLPPKTLTKMDFTLGSDSNILSAIDTCFGPTPPPRSRKLAGFPPFRVMMSIVAMARPAPLTMHPMLPSMSMYTKLWAAASLCGYRYYY